MSEQTEAGRILEAKTKGLSLRQIAAQEGITVHKVRTTVQAPAILKEIATHRTKYAVTSYENACRITEIISKVIPELDPKVLVKDSRFLRDLAWIAKSQFEQSNSILSNLIKDANTTGDQELEEAAKLLAAKVLRREAAEAKPTIDAQEYVDIDPEPDREDRPVGGDEEIGSDPPSLGG